MVAGLEQFEERLRSKEWRIRHLYQIRNAQGKIVPFVPRKEQMALIMDPHPRHMVPKSRKLGISTGIVISCLDDCIWNGEGVHAAHIDLTQDDANGKIEIARLAWDQGLRHPNPAFAELWRWLHAFRPLTKRNNSCLEWKNGSRQEAGVSFVGGTPQRLHWSEAGPLSVQDPKKAARVRRQSLNAVPVGGRIDIETTMEGGTFGEAYAIFKAALDMVGQDLTAEDWKFHFFAWFQHPDYKLDVPPQWIPTGETLAYFAELEQRHGIKLTRGQWAWYERRKRTQNTDMFSQFPSTPDECIRVAVAGQIYPEMTTLRANRRVGLDLTPERGVPFVTAWDLGVSDATAGWLVQVLPTQILWLRHAEFTGQGAAAIAEQIRSWEIEMGARISTNLFPHDIEARDRGSALTYRKQLEDAGIPSISIRAVPRVSNVMLGIAETRKLLAKSYFDKRTDVPRKSETGADLPSGVGCLENYRRKIDNGREVPVHDHTSHTADAARTLGQAVAAGLHVPFSEPPDAPGQIKVTKML